MFLYPKFPFSVISLLFCYHICFHAQSTSRFPLLQCLHLLPIPHFFFLASLPVHILSMCQRYFKTVSNPSTLQRSILLKIQSGATRMEFHFLPAPNLLLIDEFMLAQKSLKLPNIFPSPPNVCVTCIFISLSSET